MMVLVDAVKKCRACRKITRRSIKKAETRRQFLLLESFARVGQLLPQHEPNGEDTDAPLHHAQRNGRARIERLDFRA
jgi:hypothetical protein